MFDHPVLTTTRLTLRVPDIGDFPRMARFLASPRAAGVGGPYDEPGAWHMFCHGVACWTLFGYGALTIVHTETGDVLGQIFLNNGPLFAETEMGWMLYDGHQGQGYATEAAFAVRRWAFDQLNLQTLVSYVSAENAASAAVARRLGAVLDPKAARDKPSDLVFRHPRGR
ncbi:GNAT family N-acetyltransferase [Xaviernesmea oryzae]|uniref:GNAT family N-acetyltransferase n=2 Tax=Xaviernesmea oryzae TaxID=464029 RepID=A0A1Q9AWJ9_9HYPH|nr:GNAT family N-acetyltransferase [Xaviernesmea oryzae]